MKCYVVDLRQLRKDAIKKVMSRGTVIKCAGLTFILLAGFESSALASSGIDVQATKLYKKLIGVGKWIIIIKGGMETIKHVTEGDFPGAKKNFLGYLVTYAILWALPWAMGEVDKMFTDMEASS